MEHVDGQDLGRIIAESGSMPLGRAASITLQMADALSHIHAEGLVHRDVKPGNVLVAPGDRVKMTDFSVVQDTDETVLTLKGSLVGTVEYMAPEQIREEEADGRADIYALGAVLYEMLVGRPPFAREPGQTEMWPLMERILKTPPRNPSEIDAHIPEAVSAVIIRALAKDPALRFANMTDFASALRVALGDAPTMMIVPVALASPTESDTGVGISWTVSDAAEFECYELHQSEVRDFVPCHATLAGMISDRTATESTFPKWLGGGVRYFRVKLILKGGFAAVSNRVSIEIGKKPPIWKRRELHVLAAVALIAAFAAAYLSRPASSVIHSGPDRVKVSGTLAPGDFQQTGGIQIFVENPKVEVIEAGAIATQLEGSPGTIAVEFTKEQVAELDAAGYDLTMLPTQKITATGGISQSGGLNGGIVLRPSAISDVVFEAKSLVPIEITAAEWRNHENKLVRIRARVEEVGRSGTGTVGYTQRGHNLSF